MLPRYCSNVRRPTTRQPASRARFTKRSSSTDDTQLESPSSFAMYPSCETARCSVIYMSGKRLRANVAAIVFVLELNFVRCLIRFIECRFESRAYRSNTEYPTAIGYQRAVFKLCTRMKDCDVFYFLCIFDAGDS